MNKTFGLHLTLDIENCNQKKLVNNKFIYNLLNSLPKQFSMKILVPPYVIEYKDPWASVPGLTGFVIIAESHLSCHTFPEQNYVFFDIFSCRHFETQPIIDYLKKQFDSNKATVNVIERGKNFIVKPSLSKP